MPPLLPEEMQRMFFGPADEPNHRVNLFSLEDNKNVFWMEMN